METTPEVEQITTAAMNGDTATVLAMLDRDPDLLNVCGIGGWPPLHLAAHFGKQETAVALLAWGADVHARSCNDNANHPLHAAAASRQVALCELLLDHGADIEATQEGGYTAMHEAAQNGDIPLINLLLQRGANVNPHVDGKTPLTLAVETKREAAADLLRQHGATE